LPIFYLKNVIILYQLPYSPSDYFLFLKLKIKLKGLHFADGAEIQEAVIDELKKAQREKFSPAFQKLYGSAKSLCICLWGLL
jgi:hypothetical protein